MLCPTRRGCKRPGRGIFPEANRAGTPCSRHRGGAPPGHRHSSAQFRPHAHRGVDKGRGLTSCSSRHESLRHHDPHCDRLLRPFVRRRVRRHRPAARVLNVSPDFRPSGAATGRGFFSAPWFASGEERSPSLFHHENQTTPSGAPAPTSPTPASPADDRSAATRGHRAPSAHGLPCAGLLSRHAEGTAARRKHRRVSRRRPNSLSSETVAHQVVRRAGACRRAVVHARFGLPTSGGPASRLNRPEQNKFRVASGCRTVTRDSVNATCHRAHFSVSRNIQRRMSGRSAPPWLSLWAPSPHSCFTS
jgi:hypothetical protein